VTKVGVTVRFSKIVDQNTASVNKQDDKFSAVATDSRESGASENLLSIYQVLPEHPQDGVLFLNADGRIVEANKTAEKFYGYAREELLNKSIFDFSCDDDLALSQSQFKQALAGSITIETNHRDKDGNSFPVEVNSQVITIGKQQMLLSIIRDISEWQQVEAQYRLAQEELHKMSRAVEQSPCSIVVTDTTGNIEYVNPKFVQVTGYSIEEAFGKNPRILKSGKQPREVYEELWQQIIIGGEWRGEFENCKKNGESYWELASISPIRNAAGTITHFIAVKEDITERKRADEALRLAYAELDQIFNIAADGMCVISTDLTLVQVNEAFCSLMGLTREEALGKLCCEVFSRKQCHSTWCPVNRIQKGAERVEYDVELIRRDGRKISAIMTAAPFCSPNGELIGIVETLKDITQRKRNEQALNKEFMLAAKIQRGFLPQDLINEFVQTQAIYKPLGHASGDLYDYIWNEDKKVLFGCLVDVMGHGMATALQTAALRVLFRQAAEQELSLNAKMNWINQTATPYFAEDSFAAAICFELDFVRNTLTYASGGIHAFLRLAADCQELVRLPGVFIGMLKNAQYEQYTLPITAGDSFIFMTDGLYELLPQQESLQLTDCDNAINMLKELAQSKQRTDDATAVILRIQ
jgi:PAS domain S-box-containing protein